MFSFDEFCRSLSIDVDQRHRLNSSFSSRCSTATEILYSRPTAKQTFQTIKDKYLNKFRSIVRSFIRCSDVLFFQGPRLAASDASTERVSTRKTNDLQEPVSARSLRARFAHRRETVRSSVGQVRLFIRFSLAPKRSFVQDSIATASILLV